MSSSSGVPAAKGETSAPRSRNRRGHGALLRLDIIDAARRVLDREGNERGVTIRAVTREAGIAPQSFYLQFASIGDVLFAIYERGHDTLYSILSSAGAELPAAASAQDRLLAIAAAYLRFSRENPAVYRTLMGSVGQVHPDWDPAQLPGTATYELLQTAVAAARPDLDDPAQLFVTTTVLWTQLHGIASLTLDRLTFPWPPDNTLLSHTVAGGHGMSPEA